jgi:hypothetical protein
VKKPDLDDRSGWRLPDWAVVLLMTQAVALLIALVTPVTPSKTGSKWSPADLFLADPGYLEKVFASYVTVNVLMALIALAAWLSIRRGRSK